MHDSKRSGGRGDTPGSSDQAMRSMSGRLALATASETGMGRNVLECTADDLTFAAVGEFLRGVLEREPDGLADLDAHGLRDLVDAPGLVAQKKEADDLEAALRVAPGADVDVLDVGEFGDERGGYAGLFAHFADGGLGGLLAGVDNALGKGQHEFARRFFAAGAGARL